MAKKKANDSLVVYTNPKKRQSNGVRGAISNIFGNNNRIASQKHLSFDVVSDRLF